jgi:hypothetical protein
MLPHGESSGFESWARLSVPWVWLSSLDGDVIGDDTFFRHIFPCGPACFDLFPLELQKFLTLDSSLRVPLVMHLDILSNSKTLHEFDEGFEGWGWWLLRLFLGLLLVGCFDLRTLFDLQSEGESLLLSIDVELNLSSSHINVCICRTPIH